MFLVHLKRALGSLLLEAAAREAGHKGKLKLPHGLSRNQFWGERYSDSLITRRGIEAELPATRKYFLFISPFLPCAHCVCRACASLTAYTCKSLQRLDQADVYAPRIRHCHASGG